MAKKNNYWDVILSPRTGWFNVDLNELLRYRDLIFMFVKRDFVTFYKQTILGPIWYIIQPLVNTIVFTIIFGNLAKIPTDGIPPFLFYMAGNVAWSYFAVCLTGTSNTFVVNSQIFGKVYFPRLVIPIAQVIIALLQFVIQFSIFLIFLAYFHFKGADIKTTYLVFFLPLLLIHMAFASLGFGILISALTSKYRDLTFVMTFAVQLWMYITPIVYPLTSVPQKYRILVAINPMTAIVETFRGAFLGVSSIEPIHIILSIITTITVFIIGIILFYRVEKTFMDTV